MNLDWVNVVLAYANVIVITGDSRDYVTWMTQNLQESSEILGPEVSQQKPNYVCYE